MDINNISYLDIELALVDYYNMRKNIIVPNCFISFGTGLDHECDLLIIKKSGYAEEIEIKMSKSDLNADFKKKHGHNNEKLKYLYYAMPLDLYEKCEKLIPEYAGVFIIRKYNGKVKASKIKQAPKKKCRKLTEAEILKIAHLGAMRIWKLKKKLNN